MKNMTFRRITAAAAALALVLSLAACGEDKQEAGNVQDTGTTTSATTEETTAAASEETKPEEGLLGEWEMNDGDLEMDKNPEAKAAFEKALTGLVGYRYEPVALLGTQLVSGTNYCILCRGFAVTPDAKPIIQLLTVYEDLEGNASIIAGEVLLSSGENGEAVGEYAVNDGPLSLDENPDVKAAFEKAFEGFTGAGYEPVAYLGHQLVSGTNYKILCRETVITANAPVKFALVTIYEDLEGNAEVNDIENIDVAGQAEETAEFQLPNPFRGFASMEDAAAAAGFEMEVPDAPAEYPYVVYRTMGTNMIEVIYYTEEGGDEAYRIRKGIASLGDISGDFNTYEETTEQQAGDVTVSMRGNGGAVYVATWESGDYTYAIDVNMGGAGLSQDEVLALVGEVK